MDSTAPIRNLFQSLPPLLTTIQDQTGMSPPNWLVQNPDAAGEGQRGGSCQTDGEWRQERQQLDLRFELVDLWAIDGVSGITW